jgi:hypothetical protein
MAKKSISPEQENASAPTQNSDDTGGFSRAAQSLFGAVVHEELRKKEEPKDEPAEEKKELPSEEQPANEDAADEVFAEFGSRKFKDKDELLGYAKKVYGDNARMVGQIRDLQTQMSELQNQISAKKDIPKSERTAVDNEELAYAQKNLDDAKKQLESALIDMGFVKNDAIEPFVEERQAEQLKELEAFVEENPDFWEYEKQILALDGKENPVTGKAFTFKEAYYAIKVLANPSSVSKKYEDGVKDAKKQIAATKAAAMGSSKSAAGNSPDGGMDILDAMIRSRA